MSSQPLRVLLTTNIPAPYMIDYLTELGKKTELTVLFERAHASDRDAAWYKDSGGNAHFKAIFLHGIPCGGDCGFSFGILQYLNPRRYDRIIIANPTTPTGILALLYCRWSGIPFFLQSEGGFQGSGRGLKEKFKTYLMERASFYLTGMGGNNDYFLRYGADPARLGRYPFASMTEQDLANAYVLSDGEKQQLRGRLDIRESRVILSVGRFSYLRGYGKGYDILMRLAKQLPKDIGIYIVGDEPTAEFLRWKTEHALSQVHFVPFLSKDALADYYRAADVFVLLSRGDTWGLAVNEAMAYGLPVLSSDRCIAGVELIENGVNGYVLPLSDEGAILGTLSSMLAETELRHRMGAANREKIRAHTVEHMADVIYGYIRNETVRRV
ncbi:MAG: glycosyltransferase [Ruminococcaceae bacterium]|nr:glycosyltransferase [Oscillospiraceae bacterium]